MGSCKRRNKDSLLKVSYPDSFSCWFSWNQGLGWSWCEHGPSFAADCNGLLLENIVHKETGKENELKFLWKGMQSRFWRRADWDDKLEQIVMEIDKVKIFSGQIGQSNQLEMLYCCLEIGLGMIPVMVSSTWRNIGPWGREKSCLLWELGIEQEIKKKKIPFFN